MQNHIDGIFYVWYNMRYNAGEIITAMITPFKEDLSILKSYALDKQTEDKILYKNAVKLLGI